MSFPLPYNCFWGVSDGKYSSVSLFHDVECYDFHLAVTYRWENIQKIMKETPCCAVMHFIPLLTVSLQFSHLCFLRNLLPINVTTTSAFPGGLNSQIPNSQILNTALVYGLLVFKTKFKITYY